MKLSEARLQVVIRDLGLNLRFEKGKAIPVKKCWHFCTDGHAVDVLFYDQEDFVDAMNQIYVIAKKYHIIILAFCLMDNHIHFCIYGELEECKAFFHEYLRMLSMRIQRRHHIEKKCLGIPIEIAAIQDDTYLKTVICYIVKNPSSAGLPYTAYDYPWGSGALYFRRKGLWTSPLWTRDDVAEEGKLNVKQRKKIIKTNEEVDSSLTMIGNMISPEEYIPIELVEMIFRTAKGYSFFLNYSKDEDVEKAMATYTRLSIPDSELRQHKKEICKSMFGSESSYNLTTKQRIRLAKSLRSKYECSAKQVAKVVGLVYSEVKGLI